MAVTAMVMAAHAMPAAAAPTTSDGTGTHGEESAAEARPLRDLPVAGSGDQTLDRLIQLQPRTAGIEFKDRPAAAPSGLKQGLPQNMPAAAKPALQPPPQTSSGLFGSGAVPRPLASHSTSNVEPPWKQRELANTPGGPGAGARDELPAARLLLIPREIVLYIRENREWVIGGSLAALALFWAGSTAFARRRARAHG